MTTVTNAETCPCANGKSYGNCCKPLHTSGHAGLGATAEATMRSRYCAYVLRDALYLQETWHPTTRPASIEFSDAIEWHGLTVVDTSGGVGLDAAGTVEFRARFKRDDAYLELHELSSFVRENGRWFYVNGVDPEAD